MLKQRLPAAGLRSKRYSLRDLLQAALANSGGSAAIITVGRGEDCDIVLGSDCFNKTSRTHARLLWQQHKTKGGQLSITDAGSSNGTFVNSRLLGPQQQQQLKDGDTVCFGGLPSASDDKHYVFEVQYLQLLGNLGRPCKRSSIVSKKSPAPCSNKPQSKVKAPTPEVVDLTGNATTPADACRSRSASTPPVAWKPLFPLTHEKGSDSEVCIVEPPSRSKRRHLNSNIQLTGNEDLVITGSVGKAWNVDFPHARPDCGMKPYKKFAHLQNVAFCHKCYCFVCDDRAQDCKEWGSGLLTTDHCNAHSASSYFSSLRNKRKRASLPGPRGPPPSRTLRSATAGTVPSHFHVPAGGAGVAIGDVVWWARQTLGQPQPSEY